MERTRLNKFTFVLALGIIAFATIAYGGVHQAVLAVLYILIAVLAVLWAVDRVRSGEIRFSIDPFQLVVLAAAVYGFIQIIPFGSLPTEAGVSGIPRTISLEPFATLVSATHFLALFIFFAVVLSLIDSADRVRKVIMGISVFGFIYAFYAVIQSVLSPDKIFGIYGRIGVNIFGTFVNRNHFAAWMEMAVALPLGLLLSGAVAKDKRLLYGTAVTLMGASIVVSASRGGLVAFLAQVLFLTLVTYAARRRKLGLRIALAAGLIAIVIGGAVFVGGDTSLTRIAEGQATASPSEGRNHIWAVSLKVIENGMPLGVGLGAFGTGYAMLDPSSGLQRVEQAHNDYLQVLTDAGIPGALLGIAFLILLYRSAIKVLSAEEGYGRAIGVGSLAAIMGVLVHSLFDFVLHTTAVAMLFLLMLCLLCSSKLIVSGETKTGYTSRVRRRRTPPNPQPFQPHAQAATGEIASEI